jgi:hypothetical protein
MLGRLSNQRPNAVVTAMPLKARDTRDVPHLKDPKLEWIHSPLIDREESQVGAAYGITGADKQDGDGDGQKEWGPKESMQSGEKRHSISSGSRVLIDRHLKKIKLLDRQ